MRVLVIPEDPTLDQFILKPVVEQLFEAAERQAQVEVLQDPHLGGVDEALDRETVAAIVADNAAMIDLFLLVVDRDCDRRGNSQRAAARAQENAGRLLACLAVEEVETWMLALHRELLEAPWDEVRRECDPRERYAEPLLTRQRWGGPGRGRKRAMRALAGQWRALGQRCPEIAELSTRVSAWLGSQRGDQPART